MAVAEEDVPASGMARVAFGQCGGIGRSWIFLHVFVVSDTVIKESPPCAVRAQGSVANGDHSGRSKNLVFSRGQKIRCHGWIRMSESSSHANKRHFDDCVVAPSHA